MLLTALSITPVASAMRRRAWAWKSAGAESPSFPLPPEAEGARLEGGGGGQYGPGRYPTIQTGNDGRRSRCIGGRTADAIFGDLSDGRAGADIVGLRREE